MPCGRRNGEQYLLCCASQPVGAANEGVQLQPLVRVYIARLCPVTNFENHQTSGLRPTYAYALRLLTSPTHQFWSQIQVTSARISQAPLAAVAVSNLQPKHRGA